jgi:putative tricarboxylic transport membrane protein
MTKDRVTGLLALLLGGVYLAAAFRVRVLDAGDPTGPRAFPFLVAALVIASGAALLFRDRFGARSEPLAWRIRAERGVWIRIALTIGCGIAYGLVLDGLGYLLATFLFMLAVSSFVNVGRHAQNLAVAAGFSLVTFVSFGLVLKLSLPRGILAAVLPF